MGGLWFRVEETRGFGLLGLSGLPATRVVSVVLGVLLGRL